MLTEKQGCAKHTGTKIVILRAFRNKLLLVHYLNTAPCLGKVERIREKSKKKRIKKKKKFSFENTVFVTFYTKQPCTSWA